MSRPRHYRYCWDTSVFLGWLNRESSAPQADIEAVLNEVYAKRSTLILSVVTYTEVLSAKHSKRQRDAWDGFFEAVQRASSRCDLPNSPKG